MLYTMRSVIITMIFVLFTTCAAPTVQDHKTDYTHMDRSTRQAYQRTEDFLKLARQGINTTKLSRHSRIDTIVVDRKAKTLSIHFNSAYGDIPFREETVYTLRTALQASLGRKFSHYSLQMLVGDTQIEELIPNYYRSSSHPIDRQRIPRAGSPGIPLVRNISKPWQAQQGLNNRNIALWHSHGWYYEQKLKRWEWQRARVFQTVEDLLPMSFTLPYLVPMLENAGAQVFMPRERDIQRHEVVIDNDSALLTASYVENAPKTSPWLSSAKQSGFAAKASPYTAGENPFQMGTFRYTSSDSAGAANIQWIPDIPEQGRYAVYVSYGASPGNVSDAHYTVYHLGGETDFLVNQQLSGNTWVYLGHFSFAAGQNPQKGQVTLTSRSSNPRWKVSADAVRFGGGMGTIEREGQVSGRPRFVEAARYYLQYAGMPDTLVFSFNNEHNDYKDDYQCRGEWVNYLRGAPYGPNKDRSVAGLGIPIDVSFAFHTDAGFTRNDTVIGTLSIYSDEGDSEETAFPDSMSRLANRDLADILQTQLVDDIRRKYDPAWKRRMLWNRSYSESYRPNVPAVLLELLSHHNFLDMKFANDPRFKFDVSRSIYKALLKFIATQNGLDYVIQPLPVKEFQAVLPDRGTVALSWTSSSDPLEPSAVADQYIVYAREEGGDFDNGVLVAEAQYTRPDLKPGVIYSFKVTAVNAGGESFPSEILSVCDLQVDKPPVLIINAFDRISAAATIESDAYLGFADFKDAGVPDKYDVNYIGTQYDLMADSPWLDDDAPGHGASYGDLETTIIPGNSFDFPLIHGQSIKAAGYSFVSASDEALMAGLLDIMEYPIIDLIMGEEKEVAGPKPESGREFRAFPPALQRELADYSSAAGNIFVSGAYIGTDLFSNDADSVDMAFGQDILKFRFRTDHAVKTGGVKSVSPAFPLPAGGIRFNTEIHPSIYTVESPDAIEAAHPEAFTIFRYAENNTSAAVAYLDSGKVISFGFPFETILKQSDRDQVMQLVLKTLEP